MKRITIKDISSATNLSLATVSNVLRGNTMYAEDTRKLIWDTAHRLGYVPNKQAQELRRSMNPGEKSRNHLIMRIDHQPHESIIGNLYEALRNQMFEWETLQRGYFPTVYWYQSKEGFKCPPLIDNLIDGIVLGLPHQDIIEMFRNRLPTVLMDVPSTPYTTDIPRVNMNIQNGFITLLEKVRQLGHSKAAILAGPERGSILSNDMMFLNSCNSALHFHGMEADRKHILRPAISPDTHWKVMEETAAVFAKLIRNHEITIILCMNIHYAEALYQLLLGKYGILIPEEVSLLSINHNIQSSEHDIACIAYDWRKMIQITLDLLTALIEKRPGTFYQEILVEPLIRSGSTLAHAPGMTS